MDWYVYVIKSIADGSYYKGYSQQPLIRLQQHNNGESSYTSHKMPWILVYVERMHSKSEALLREKNLKKAGIDRIEALIKHPKNIIREFISEK